MSCDMFMDYTYDGEIALEAIKPIQAILNVIDKIISFFHRLLNQFKRLRKVTIPKKQMKNMLILEKNFNKVGAVLKALTKSKDPDVSDMNNALDAIENSEQFNVYMNASAKDNTLFKDEYKTVDSKEYVKSLNNNIAAATNLKGKLNSVFNNASEKDNQLLKTGIRFFQMRAKFYAKVFTFRKPVKDPENIQRMDKTVTGTSYT